MRPTNKRNEPAPWPPDDGEAFIRTERFGALLVDLVVHLAQKYPRMDFADAVAKVFTWLDTKLVADPQFINSLRFPRPESFVAYLRQAVWNAARLAERERRRHNEIKALPRGQDMIVREVSPEELSELIEAVESLLEPHKTVFHQYFFDEVPFSAIASIYNLTEEDVRDKYIEAVDMLRERLFGDSD